MSKRNTKKSNIILNVFKFLIPYTVINALIFIFYTDIPKITIDTPESDNNISEVSFHIKSLLPIVDIKVINNDIDTAYSKLNNKYSIQITNNNPYKIIAKSLNQVSSSYIIDFNILDNTAPTIDTNSSIIANGILTVRFNDEGTGINYDGIYAQNPKGDIIKPINTDKVTNSAQFNISNDKVLTIFVSDLSGNISETTFTAS